MKKFRKKFINIKVLFILLFRFSEKKFPKSLKIKLFFLSKNCHSNENAGALYISENSKIYFEDSRIENCHAQFGAIFFLQENYHDLSIVRNSTFIGNYGISFLIDISKTSLIIENSFFYNNSNNIFSLIDSKLEFSNSVISDTLCSKDLVGCILKAIETSIILLNNNSFYNISNKKEEGNIWLDDSNLNMSFNQMRNIGTYKEKGDCVSSYNSSLVIINSKFENFYTNCIWSSESSLIVNSSNFQNSIGSLNIQNNLGVIYCSSCKFIEIFNSNFINNTFADFGSALYLISSQNEVFQEVNIRNSIFKSNKAFASGTVYIQNQNASIEDCLFEDNAAQRGAGLILFNNNGNLF